jgi:predicted enzyme related to lactoylglutathione lyase
MLRGLTTVRFHTTDLEAAERWYTELLGTDPYFRRPGYAEFRIGDYEHELGLLDSKYVDVLGAHDGAPTAGAVVYWHVDDVHSALDRLLSLGATEHEPVREFGDGFVGAAVVDPFGNILGIMQNRHYLDILAAH